MGGFAGAMHKKRAFRESRNVHTDASKARGMCLAILSGVHSQSYTYMYI